MVSFWIIQQSLGQDPPKKNQQPPSPQDSPIPIQKKKTLPANTFPHHPRDLCPPFPALPKVPHKQMQRFFLKPHHWSVLEFSISKSLPPALVTLAEPFIPPPPPFFFLGTPLCPGFPVAISPLGMLESYEAVDSQSWRRGFGELGVVGKGGGVKGKMGDRVRKEGGRGVRG